MVAYTFNSRTQAIEGLCESEARLDYRASWDCIVEPDPKPRSPWNKATPTLPAGANDGTLGHRAGLQSSLLVWDPPLHIHLHIEQPRADTVTISWRGPQSGGSPPRPLTYQKQCPLWTSLLLPSLGPSRPSFLLTRLGFRSRWSGSLGGQVLGLGSLYRRHPGVLRNHTVQTPQ